MMDVYLEQIYVSFKEIGKKLHSYINAFKIENIAWYTKIIE